MIFTLCETPFDFPCYRSTAGQLHKSPQFPAIVVIHLARQMGWCVVRPMGWRRKLDMTGTEIFLRCPFPTPPTSRYSPLAKAFIGTEEMHQARYSRNPAPENWPKATSNAHDPAARQNKGRTFDPDFHLTTIRGDGHDFRHVQHKSCEQRQQSRCRSAGRGTAPLPFVAQPSASADPAVSAFSSLFINSRCEGVDKMT